MAPEKEVVVMSKIELCAKNDDIALFESIPYEILIAKDENKKTILKYMLQYDCRNLVSAFFKKHSIKSILACNDSKSGCPQWYTEDVIELLLKYNLEEELEQAGAFSFEFINNGDRRFSSKINIYTLPYQEKIISSKTLSKEFKLKYIKGLKGSEIITLLVSLLKKEDKDNFTWLCEWVQKLNAENYVKLESAKQEKRYMTTVSSCDYPCQEYEPVGSGGRYRYFIIHPTADLVYCLIDAGYIEYAKKANAQKQVLSEEQLQLAILKKDGKGDSEEALLLSVLSKGILNIDALLEFKDLKFIKKVLFEYPIHQFEILAKWFQEKNWRALFRYGVDTHSADDIPGLIVKNQFDKLEKVILGRFKNTGINSKYFYFVENGKQHQIFETNPYQNYQNIPKTVVEAMELLARCRERIIDELSLRLDKEKTIGDLTKEYFQAELAKGNSEIVIIKLCVRLEAILRCDYHYEGDFSDMLNQYCNSKLRWREDDGWGYMVDRNDDKTIRLLNNLRIKRNSIVHSEKTNIELSLEDIHYCIDYICKME